MLELKLGSRRIVDQGDRPSWPTQKVHAVWQPFQLGRRLRIGHLQMIQAAVCQTCQAGLGQVADVEVRMQTKAEGHLRGTAVLDGGGDLQRPRRWTHIHHNQKCKGVGLQRFLGAALLCFGFPER